MDGAIDVPYRLLLSVVLIAMGTAILYPALEAYSQSEMEHRLAIAVEEIGTAAVSVHRHPGSSRTVHIDVPPSGVIRLERLTIGGDLASTPANASIITWALSNGIHGRDLVCSSSGPLPLAGPDGGPMEIETFPCLIVMERRPSPPGSLFPTFVECRVL